MLIPKSGKPGLLRSRRPGIPSVFALRFAVQTHAPGNDDTKNDDKYITIQCLFVTFLFIPALLPSPVQSCYDWMKHSIWQKNKLQDTKQIQKKSIDKSKSDFANK